MPEALKGQAGRETQLAGYSMALKDVLGVGLHINESRPETYILLVQKAGELRKRVFGSYEPKPAEVEASINDGTILDFRDPRRPKQSLKEDFSTYMQQLAYHYFLKRDVLRLASENRVVVAGNPASERIRYPVETLIVPAEAGRRQVEEFLSAVGGHMSSKYGLRTRPPEEAAEDLPRKIAWAQVEGAGGLMSRPGDFEESLRLQMPPDSDDVRDVRAYFNRWYVQQPGVQERVVDAMLKGPVRSKGDLGGFKVDITVTPEERVRNLLQDRI